jgi:beta-phosphoglucomutase-like phosphatase (HAD superfamily)
MFAVLLDFNGTMFFDSSLHLEAWSKIYQDLYPQDLTSPNAERFCGPCNDAILQNLAPWLTAEDRLLYSEKKEELYRQACIRETQMFHLAPGAESFLEELRSGGVSFGLASASIKANIDFFFDSFALGRWFREEDVVYDDGTYPNKGAMHLEAARRLQRPLADCLLVEDSLSSIRQAKQNGAGCIVAIGSTAAPEELIAAGADYHIRDFSEFDFAWLEKANLMVP